MTIIGPTNLEPDDLAARLALTEMMSASYPPDILGPQSPPDLATLAPSSIVVDTMTKVTVTGTGFTHNSVVYVDGTAHPTEYVSSTEVWYNANATSVGSQDVTVRNRGTIDSDVLPLTVTAAVGAEGAQAPVQSETPPAAPEPEPEPPPTEPAP